MYTTCFMWSLCFTSAYIIRPCSGFRQSQNCLCLKSLQRQQTLPTKSSNMWTHSPIQIQIVKISHNLRKSEQITFCGLQIARVISLNRKIWNRFILVLLSFFTFSRQNLRLSFFICIYFMHSLFLVCFKGDFQDFICLIITELTMYFAFECPFFTFILP